MMREKIMIIKHGALGDIVQALDGFASVRAGHPDAHVTLLTTPPFVDFARAMPFFNEVHVDPRAKPWKIKEALKIRRLFTSGFTRIYDFQGSGRTRHYFNYFIPKGVEFVGIAKGASHLLPDMTSLNNRERMIGIATFGGCPEQKADLAWFDDKNKTWPDRSVVLIPGCSPAKPAKRWPVEGFIDLAHALIKKGYTPVLAGTEVDREVGDAIAKAVPEVVSFIGSTNLMELASLFRRAEFLVGGDTGPVFIGARLGCPTVMVMSSHTNPVMSAPVGSKAGWLKEDDIAAITPAMVLAKADELISS
jgi:ADP-heptose:LPS heptosyltransferase